MVKKNMNCINSVLGIIADLHNKFIADGDYESESFIKNNNTYYYLLELKNNIQQ